jgi:outer membrane protein OmpA-like peptidoglycan-associated protein
MSRILIGLTAAASLVACSGCYVDAEKYERDVETLKAHCDAQGKRIHELEPIAEAYKILVEKYQFSKNDNEMYDEVARELKAVLESLKGSGADFEFDARTGKVTFATDVLFDSGSFTVTPRGIEVLKKFETAMRAQNVRFRIVGHTDNAKIARPSTKEKLDTDTNKELSVRRAIAVMGQLMKFGVKESRFDEVTGMGSTRPAANPAKSRRVEIFLVKDNVRNSSVPK